jgi:hypothetical protein
MRRAHLTRHTQGADIPGDVPLQFGLRKPQILQPPRNSSTGMIDHDDEIRSALPPGFEVGRRFVGGQQAINRLRH